MPPPRDELVIKVLVALEVPGVDVHEIRRYRRHVIEVMQRYTGRRRERRPEVGLGHAELFRLEAIVRWLDAADVRLKQKPPPASPPAVDAPLEPERTMEVSQ